jgi:hypothetical protein
MRDLIMMIIIIIIIYVHHSRTCPHVVDGVTITRYEG